MEFRSFKLKYTNCFLLRHPSGWLLIDTGYDWEWDAFLAGLARTGVGIHEITHLLMTHHHDDHAGLINPLVKANPGIQVLMSRPCADYLATGRHHSAPGAGYVTRRMALLAGIKARFDKAWTHTYPPYIARAQDRVLSLPVRLRELGIELDGAIVATPGHTADSTSLIMDEGTVFCGDAAANFFKVAGLHYCVVAVCDLSQYYLSWNLLLSGGAKVLYPSHGTPFAAEKLRKKWGRHTQVVPFKQSYAD
jgi:hydroxyacylglutathione hydrolase